MTDRSRFAIEADADHITRAIEAVLSSLGFGRGFDNFAA
jgi:hypothetical protein